MICSWIQEGRLGKRTFELAGEKQVIGKVDIGDRSPSSGGYLLTKWRCEAQLERSQIA